MGRRNTSSKSKYRNFKAKIGPQNLIQRKRSPA
jgi:hypothetical protein